MTIYDYSVEVEFEYGWNDSHPTPTMKKHLKDAGIRRLSSVKERHKDSNLPVEPKDQKFETVIVSAYHDGSVDSEVVFASDDMDDISDIVNKITEEMRFTSSCGQHVSITYPSKANWYDRKKALSVQNIAFAIEKGMLLKQKEKHRGNEFCKWYTWHDRMFNDKYSGVFLKTIQTNALTRKRFKMVEFRLHNPILSVLPYFVIFPNGMKSIGKKKVEQIGYYDDPIKNDASCKGILNILKDEMGRDWNKIDQYIKLP